MNSQKQVHSLNVVLDSELFSLLEDCYVIVDFKVDTILTFKYSWPSSVSVFKN